MNYRHPTLRRNFRGLGKDLANLLTLWAFAVLITACSTHQPVTESATQLPVRLNAPIMPGDNVRIGFFRNIRPQNEAYKINSGDLLAVDVFDHPELTVPRVLVLPDGHISLPLIGRLLAEGLQVDALSTELAKHYTQENVRNPKVNVSVTEGNYKISSMLAEMQSKGGAQIEVQMDQVGYLDLPFIEPIFAVGRELADVKKEVSQAYKSRFGDALEISLNLSNAQPRVLFVIGEVQAPGAVRYADKMAPLSAIASAGGFLNSGSKSGVRLIRPDGNGGASFINFSAKENLAGTSSNNLGFVQPGDIIFVPKTGVAMANQAVAQYIRNMLPFDVGLGFGYTINDKLTVQSSGNGVGSGNTSTSTKVTNPAANSK